MRKTETETESESKRETGQKVIESGILDDDRVYLTDIF